MRVHDFVLRNGVRGVGVLIRPQFFREVHDMPAPRIELLEVRRMFILGTEGSDVIEIQSVDNDPLSYRILLNGTVVDQLAFPSGGQKINVDGLGGDDLITFDGLLDFRAFLIGSGGDDTIVGGSRYDVIHGGAGNDLIFGKGGPDSIAGGAGNDTIRGGEGFDDLYGDEDPLFDDPALVAPGEDLIFGEEGNDVLRGGDGDDLLNGGAGNDELLGGADDDKLLGADGDDTMRIVRSSELLIGAEAGDDMLDGGTGIDRLVILSFGAPFYLTLDGVGNDGRRDDRANVMPTFERFEGGSMGDGSVLDFSRSPLGVSASIAVSDFDHTAVFAIACIGSPFGDDLRFTGFTPMQIDGRDGDDTIIGSSANDQIFGGLGNDSLSGYLGKDAIVGDEGDDFIEGGAGNDRIAAGIGDDVVYGDDASPFGTTLYGSDTIEGNAGNDALIGGGNNDVILGEGGRDTLIGGGGNDRMYGGPDAADKILGGTGTDSAAQDDKDTYDSVETLLT
jgi:Ca2+-binding RTX toxin-like protein